MYMYDLIASTFLDKHVSSITISGFDMKTLQPLSLLLLKTIIASILFLLIIHTHTHLHTYTTHHSASPSTNECPFDGVVGQLHICDVEPSSSEPWWPFAHVQCLHLS